MNDGEILMTIIGGQAPYNITWSDSQTGNPIVDLNAGLYSVVVIDANNCMTTEIIEVTVYTGIINAEDLTVEIYPNPTNGKFTVKMGFIADEIVILDALGRVVLSENVNSDEFSFNADLQPGIYFVKIVSDSEQVLRKLIIE
jgi:hypothetical protein